MDVHLPDVDGLTLVQQLQAHEQYRTIPVIAQTAMAMKAIPPLLGRLITSLSRLT